MIDAVPMPVVGAGLLSGAAIVLEKLHCEGGSHVAIS
jgi:hypothetical protein